VTRPLGLADIRSDAAGIAWPPVSTGPAAMLAALLAQLEETQWLPPDAIARRQFRQLEVLAAHAQRHSDYFRLRLARAKLTPAELATPEGFSRLPVMVRRDLQSAGAKLFCDTVPDGHAPVGENFSSGSTGEPVMVKRTFVNQLDWMAMTLRDHLWWCRDFSGRQAAIRHSADSYAEQKSWGKPVGLLFASGASARIPLNTPITEAARKLAAFRPNTLLLHPNVLAGLTEHCRENGIRFPELHDIRTFAETLWPHVREDAEAWFGVRVCDLYSSQEAGYVALQCPESGLYHVMAETAIVEVLDEAGAPCGEGKPGRVVITDLHNFATPLIRYDIGDWAEFGGLCVCGRGLPTLRRILGRHRNLLVMPDGSRVWPLAGVHQVRAVAPVRQFQFIQKSRERIEARLVVDRQPTAQEQQALRDLLHGLLGHPFELDFRYETDPIPMGPGGKFEQFISEAT
jgi:phenylacetate-CoA ligase